MKKVFFVYTSAGAGHQKAAEAIYQYFKDNHPGCELKIIDLLDYAPVFFRLLYSKGYILLISKFPWLWYLLYRIAFFFANNFLVAYADYLMASDFIKLLIREKPDIVVSTHFLTSSILTVFKKKNPAQEIKLVSIITDYNLHPLWLGEGVYLYVAACDFVREELLRRSVMPDKIRVCGIPATEKFYRPQDRREIAQKLGVDPAAFTVLIITGAVGIGPIEEIVMALSGEVQLLVVCGKNKILYRRLTGLNLSLVRPFPLIDYVDELMSVSDVVVTKAGGLTITESLAKKLPMVFFSNIPGLESSNARVLQENGCAFNTAGIEEIKQRVLSLKNNPGFYREAVFHITRFRKSQTLMAITSEVKNLLTCCGEM